MMNKKFIFVFLLGAALPLTQNINASDTSIEKEITQGLSEEELLPSDQEKTFTEKVKEQMPSQEVMVKVGTTAAIALPVVLYAIQNAPEQATNIIKYVTNMISSAKNALPVSESAKKIAELEAQNTMLKNYKNYKDSLAFGVPSPHALITNCLTALGLKK